MYILLILHNLYTVDHSISHMMSHVHAHRTSLSATCRHSNNSSTTTSIIQNRVSIAMIVPICPSLWDVVILQGLRPSRIALALVMWCVLPEEACTYWQYNTVQYNIYIYMNIIEYTYIYIHVMIDYTYIYNNYVMILYTYIYIYIMNYYDIVWYVI